MSKAIIQLKEALRQEQQIYQGVLELADQKTLMVVRNKVKELEKLTLKEQQFIREISRFEQIRQSLLGHFAKEKELAEVPQNLSALLSFLPENDVEEIESLRQELVVTIQEISEKNRLNETLINQSLDFIQVNLEALTQLETGNPYGEKADAKNKQTRQIFDAKC
ncbi:FlgN protein [Tindallia magadiensis]|uniref:FlgN protein n=1 Tax=Tindallia magadiensis TaxID=69895 RepID=A0A1I3C6B6_9FIRM|nr:flagellar protein FlgN [Tindallia magadiensis]SFH70072.1 FlgN protein [Tindallia magadiensis]